MDIEVLDIDLGKTVCSLAGLDATGAVMFRRKLQNTSASRSYAIAYGIDNIIAPVLSLY